MDLGDICILFLSMSILFYLFYKNLAIGEIEETGTNSRLYPKHFIAPKRWMKKHFKIKDRVIPKYLYFECLMSLFFLMLRPISIAISIAFNYDKAIISILVMFQCCLWLINIIFFSVMSLIYKKNKTKPN